MRNLVKKVESSMKPVLITEDECTELYKIAWLTVNGVNFDENNFSQIFQQESPFEIISAKGHKNLYAFLNQEEIPIEIRNKKLVGLFDFDDAYNSFNGLSSAYWEEVVGEDRNGLFRKRNDAAAGFSALVLPVPYTRRRLASKAFGGQSRLEIELYFSNNVLGESHIEVDLKRPGQLPHFKGNKATFWKTAAHYEKRDFALFKKLFSKIYSLLNIEENGIF